MTQRVSKCIFNKLMIHMFPAKVCLFEKLECNKELDNQASENVYSMPVYY